MERLLHGLLLPDGQIAEEVHAIRKLGKSLRGGFTLFRLRKTSAKEIQAVGRLLSAPRDAVSRLGTWKKLGWQEDAAAAAVIAALLELQTHSAAQQAPPEVITWCVERVVAARRDLQELPPENMADRLAQGISKLGKQVASRCKKLEQPGEEDFHDARKALKAYLGAVGFLREGAVALDVKMLELSELLGDENDLTTLSNWLLAHGFTPHFVPGLWKKLERTRGKLHKKALRDARHLA
jgi:hypothetical protein